MGNTSNRSFSWLRPNYFGCMFLISWMFILMYSPIGLNDIFPGISFTSPAYISSVLCLSATSAVIAWKAKPLIDYMNQDLPRWVCAAGMVVGTVMQLASYIVGNTALEIVSGIFTGCSSATMAARWAREFSHMHVDEMMINLPMLTALTITLSFTLLYLPRAAVFAAVVLMPLASEFFLGHANQQATEEVVRPDAVIKKNKLAYALVIMFIGIIGFSTGTMDAMIEQGYFSVAFYAAIIALLVVATFAYIIRNLPEHIWAAFLIPALIVAAALIPFTNVFADSFAQIMVSTGEICFEVLLFTLMAIYAYYFKISPIGTYCAGRISMSLLNVIGWELGSRMAAAGAQNAEGTAFVVVLTMVGIEALVLVVLAALVLSRNSGNDSRRDEKDAAAMPAEAQQPLSVHELTRRRCETLRERYGLSNREFEVMVLLAQGYSSAAIQESLHIAPGTVNSHTRNIYQKLDVHSKGEIQILLDKKS